MLRHFDLVASARATFAQTALAVAIASALALCTLTDRSEAKRAGTAGVPVTVTVDRFDPGLPVRRRFLGLSFEAAAMDQLAQYAHRGDLVKLLRSLGPGLLRFGGITADQNVGWTDSATPRPVWASSAIGPAQLEAIGELARRSDWQVLLTVGLAHYEPQSAAREVAAAHRSLGHHLAAVEIGNEPDAYGKHGFRELPWIAQGYEEEVTSYREAIAALTPGVAVVGPDVSGSGVFGEWGEEEALGQDPAMLTGHHYPLGCAQTPPPSIEGLLSAATRGRESQSLGTYMAVSRLRGIPLRIDETNSVSCGGVPGISNTFASALWATGYIAQAMAAGTIGINLQGNPTNCTGYTPVCAPTPGAAAEGALRPQPDWYALLLSRALVGDRPLPTTIAGGTVPAAPSAPPGSEGSPGNQPSATAPQPASEPGTTEPGAPPTTAPNLVATPFLTPNHSVAVVLVNDEPEGTGPLPLRIDVGPGMGSAQVVRLTAPSLSAAGGVLLGGTAVAPNGSWPGARETEKVATHAGILALQLAPASGALVTIGKRPPPRRHSRAHKPGHGPKKPHR